MRERLSSNSRKLRNFVLDWKIRMENRRKYRRIQQIGIENKKGKDIIMYGSLTGNLAGITYYLYFQLLGMALFFAFLNRERLLAKVLTGSAAGSLLATWLPVLAAFFFDFTISAHVLALLLTLPLLFLAVRRLHRQHSVINMPQFRISLFRQKAFLGIFLSVMALWIYLLHTHTLLPAETGALLTGQCTYGDMNMHLGFITSLARQQSFPPDYSIMPGVKLSYPFLSDSISSSLLVLGASLRLAYILPMLSAMAQILTAVYLFAETVLASLHGSLHAAGSSTLYKSLGGCRVSPCTPGCTQSSRECGFGPLLVLVLFFLNGGLGFSYFMDWSREQTYRFSDIFTGFYTTPTNLTDQNIRWVNIIADMLLPQRATLFGYAVLFPFLWLLYRAVFQNCRHYFLPAGLFAASLPMIHTHSFLSACVVSASWMLLWLYRKVFPSPAEDTPAGFRRLLRYPGTWGLALFTVVMCLIQHWVKTGKILPGALMAMGIVPFAIAFFLGILLLIRHIGKSGWKELLSGWGIFLACFLLLALPQLLFWTFGQVAEGGFVRGHFNWGNQGDLYPWFYVKNIGMPLLLIIGGICACDRRRAPLFLPAFFLWWVGELIVFTPNTYDNNKLLYAAYLLLCIGAADYAVTLYENIHFSEAGRRLRGSLRVLAAFFLFFTAFSGILTLAREAVSQYQLYSAAQVKLAEYAEANTPPEAVFLAGTRHNNEISSLSGRNIVCGADTFLYFHGLDTTVRKADLQLMYEAPLEHMDLFEKYNVSYVVVSAFERSNYSVDEAAFQERFREIYSWEDIVLYQVPVIQ